MSTRHEDRTRPSTGGRLPHLDTVAASATGVGARAFEAPAPYVPSKGDVQRGRVLQLAVFQHDTNVPIARYAELTGKSRQGF